MSGVTGVVINKTLACNTATTPAHQSPAPLQNNGCEDASRHQVQFDTNHTLTLKLQATHKAGARGAAWRHRISGLPVFSTLHAIIVLQPSGPPCHRLRARKTGTITQRGTFLRTHVETLWRDRNSTLGIFARAYAWPGAKICNLALRARQSKLQRLTARKCKFKYRL